MNEAIETVKNMVESGLFNQARKTEDELRKMIRGVATLVPPGLSDEEIEQIAREIEHKQGIKAGLGAVPLQERLEREGMAPRCGVHVIDTETGDVVHWLRMHGVVTELYDIAVVPRARQPQMVGFRSDEIRRTVSIETA